MSKTRAMCAHVCVCVRCVPVSVVSAYSRFGNNVSVWKFQQQSNLKYYGILNELITDDLQCTALGNLPIKKP